MKLRLAALVVSVAWLSGSCKSDDDGAVGPTGASGADGMTNTLQDASAPDSQLPNTFGSCDGAPTCEVSLAAFTTNRDGFKYCQPTRDQAIVALDCASTDEIRAGTCGELYSIRDVYGQYRAYYQCVYQQSTGQLVGAILAPENVPGAEAVLRLRAIRCSGDWDDYWQFHEHQELARNHDLAAA
jgi:hypothetical protein